VQGSALQSGATQQAALTAIGAPFTGLTISNANHFSADEGTVGGFVGANWVWDDVVLGLEADYISFWNGNRASVSFSQAAQDFPPYGSVTPQATQALSIKNIGLFKARAGYAMGRFLPFVTFGLAVSEGSLSTTYGLNYAATGAPAVPAIGVRKQGWLTGGTAGVGLDILVTDNVFLRAEYNYIGFADFNGAKTTIHNVQAGIAIKY
jgi:outer membrane immunogenic protein